jgi:peptide/nickel transport system ATP-binding protein
MVNDNIILRVEDLKKWFPVRKGIFTSLFSKRQEFVKAVDGVSFEIFEGEVFGLVGESGCGKTTVGKTILRVIEPTSGKVYFKGIDIFKLSKGEMRRLRRKMQLIYQDPFESLNPRMTIYNLVGEPLSVNKLVNSVDEKVERVVKALEDVELKPPEVFLDKFPHELSGGQRQRVAIARALVLQPEFIVADEPVSMLDVSIRAEILEIMLKLKEHYGISYLFITHDLALARHICDRIAIMYLGKIMELGDVEDVMKNPLHPYTKALLDAVPDIMGGKVKVSIKGFIPQSPINIPPGCRFHPRCLKAMDLCRREEPQLLKIGNRHYVACHLHN